MPSGLPAAPRPLRWVQTRLRSHLGKELVYSAAKPGVPGTTCKSCPSATGVPRAQRARPRPGAPAPGARAVRGRSRGWGPASRGRSGGQGPAFSCLVGLVMILRSSFRAGKTGLSETSCKMFLLIDCLLTFLMLASFIMNTSMLPKTNLSIFSSVTSAFLSYFESSPVTFKKFLLFLLLNLVSFF